MSYQPCAFFVNIPYIIKNYLINHDKIINCENNIPMNEK
jgi:hypothetical protein